MGKKIIGLIISLLAITCGAVYCLQIAADGGSGEETVAGVGFPTEQESLSESENVKETEESQTKETEESETEEGYDTITSKGKIKNYSGVVVLDKNAYELFTYREECAKVYAKTVNNVSKKLKGKANVYDILVPLSSGVIFPDNRIDDVNSTDQNEAINNIYGFIDDDVNKIKVYDNLMKHRKEYIYFRTDHHWTAKGAYYAYEEFCKAKGIKPEKLESFDTRRFKGFLGSFYNDTSSKALKKTPDVITAYLPNDNAKLEFTNTNGDVIEWPIIYDVSDYTPSLKYSTFIGGDNPYTEIENKDIEDGSSCIVVKESFGNAFVPFLIDHYKKIYVVDYRYYKDTITKLQKKTKADDVIFINNLSMIRNQYLVGQFQGVVK